MNQQSLSSIVADQTQRALWEVKNVIDCVPADLWMRAYCHAPVWQQIYHMLHSLDLWLNNPRDGTFQEPPFHEDGLNNLDLPAVRWLSRAELDGYYVSVREKAEAYTRSLSDEMLLQTPPDCPYTRFTLILAQHRHLHTHMGMLMGYIVAETGLWPRVVGLEGTIPPDNTGGYF